ncbi:MAG: bifunctional folylpolyglutamate synthase/dihydrofolate synthase, partial [Sulfurimonas sp.]
MQEFLESKPLYYTEIDYTRMPRAYSSIKEKFKLPKIIHIVGTNGNGTTGRFLATALIRRGYKTLHYTSPHILEFNERIWINGTNISDQKLEQLHENLQELLPQEFIDGLSYFEYTTFLAVLAASECDYLILEAGLGGEHDATAVFENILTLVTPIDKDHEAFLGNTIE